MMQYHFWSGGKLWRITADLDGREVCRVLLWRRP